MATLTMTMVKVPQAGGKAATAQMLAPPLKCPARLATPSSNALELILQTIRLTVQAEVAEAMANSRTVTDTVTSCKLFSCGGLQYNL